MVRLRVRWTERALEQLREIGAFIALENIEAAMALVQRVDASVDRLEFFPESGRRIPEFPKTPHREVIVPPCRVIYRVDGRIVWVVHVARFERILRRSHLGN